MGDLIKEGVVETCNCGKSGICGWHSTDTECIVYGSDQIARLWECIGRWAAMIAHDGEDANLAPPDWFVDAVKAATAPPKRSWVGLTDEQRAVLNFMLGADELDGVWFGDRHPKETDSFWWRNRLRNAFQDVDIEAKLKEKNT